jgi:hypothetical protein
MVNQRNISVLRNLRQNETSMCPYVALLKKYSAHPKNRCEILLSLELNFLS